VNAALQPLTAPKFRLLFFGRLVSFLGNAFAPIALAFAVLDLTGSAGDLGIVLAARSLPTVALLLVGGVWADRLPRHVLLVTFSLLAAVTQAAAAALLIIGSAHIWQLALLEAVNGTGATFVAAAVFFAGLRLPHIGTVPAGVLRELAGGWREFRSRTWLWAIVVQFAFVNAAVAGGFDVLGPLVAKRSLGGPAVWGLVVAAESTGLMAGALLALWYRPYRPLLVATYGVLAAVPVLVTLAVVAPVPVILGAAFTAGTGFEIFGVQWDTAVQRHVPAEALSRVYAYDALGSLIFNPVGQSLAGPAVVAFGPGGTIGLSAAIVLAATLAVLAVRDVRTLPRHLPA
jgi:hypothetical protein